MKPCKSYACGNNAAPGDVYCVPCREESDALRLPKNRAKPVNWWAVFFVFAVIAAFAVLVFTGRVS